MNVYVCLAKQKYWFVFIRIVKGKSNAGPGLSKTHITGVLGKDHPLPLWLFKMFL
jgi:hypothetical protein